MHKSCVIMAERFGWMIFHQSKRVRASDAEKKKQSIGGYYLSIRIYYLTSQGAEIRENLPNVWKFGIIIAWMDTMEFFGWLYRKLREIGLLFMSWYLGKNWDAMWENDWNLVKWIIEFLFNGETF